MVEGEVGLSCRLDKHMESVQDNVRKGQHTEGCMSKHIVHEIMIPSISS
jgi:hypothetical protein